MPEYNTDNITNYITRVLKLIFEAYKKLLFFINFVPTYENVK